MYHSTMFHNYIIGYPVGNLLFSLSFPLVLYSSLLTSFFSFLDFYHCLLTKRVVDGINRPFNLSIVVKSLMDDKSYGVLMELSLIGRLVNFRWILILIDSSFHSSLWEYIYKNRLTKILELLKINYKFIYFH